MVLRCVDSKIGFGVLNSDAMVRAAQKWENVPEQHVCKIIHADKDLIGKYESVIDCALEALKEVLLTGNNVL